MKTSIAAFAACLMVGGCGAAEPPSPRQQSPIAGVAMQYLDSAHPSIVQPVEAIASAAHYFVRVEVVKVENPGKYAVSCNVDFRDADGNSVPLGTFSLFPPDNPGTFIVPVQGKVRAGGSLVISLVMVDTPPPGTTVRLAIGRISLTAG